MSTSKIDSRFIIYAAPFLNGPCAADFTAAIVANIGPTVGGVAPAIEDAVGVHRVVVHLGPTPFQID